MTKWRGLRWGACALLLLVGLCTGFTLSASAATPDANTTFSGINATWIFTQPGHYNLTLNVSDPGGTLNNTTYTVTVINIAAPNRSMNTTLINWIEDTNLVIEQNVSGQIGEGLNWSWLDSTVNRVSFGPSITWNFSTPGRYNISLEVVDPQGAIGSGFLLINVSDITAPQVELIGPLSVDQFITANFSANVTDNDPASSYPNWTFEWWFVNASGNNSRSGRNVSFISGVTGDVGVQVLVKDASGNSNVSVQTLRINAAPVIVGSPPPEANVSQPWSWTIVTFDPDTSGPALGFQLVESPPGMTLSGDTLSWTPNASQIGEHNVTFTLSDAYTTASITFTISVPEAGAGAGNRAPYFVSIPLLDARVGRQYEYLFEAWDDDAAQNGSLQFFLGYASEPGFFMDGFHRRISWNPPWQPTGEEAFLRNVTITLMAFDGVDYTNQTFTIRFRNPPNQWPVERGSLSLGECTVNQEFPPVHLNQYWSDPDDAIGLLGLSTNRTDYVQRSEISRVLSWRIDYTNPSDPVAYFRCVGAGTVEFNLTAEDPSGGRSGNFVIYVAASRPPAASPSGLPDWLLWLLIAGIAAAAVGAAVAVRRSRAASSVAHEALRTASNIPKAVVQPAEPLAPAGTKKDTYVIEALFIIYEDGRLIHSRLDLSAVKFEDPELVASMFSAVQSFIKDSFSQGGELNRLGFGDDTIMIERGKKIFMACVIYGEPTADLVDGMKETLHTIENAFAGIIEEWDGSTDNLSGIEQYVAPFVATTAHLTRADVKLAITEKAVKMVSELEFFQGFVRLKCGVKNDTDSVITKVTVSVDFNEDVLRLHHVEPDTYKRQGSEVQVGVLNSQEKGSLAYYFDPQICTESMIDGVARYRDAKGGVHSVNMKTRKAEVVCPIFFTKEHANTAMLKRLVEGELDQRDSKVYAVSLPQGTKWPDVFSLLKEVVMSHDVHPVREFVTEDPYQAEAWFYGETKVKGYKVVIRASVHAAGGHVEFFAASTQIPAITGLLAEFNHTLQKRAPAKAAGAKFVPEFDEEIKDDVQRRSLMPKVGQAELEGGETDQEDR